MSKPAFRPSTTYRYPPVKIQVKGDFACFTRPEMSSERVSYPIMTPTAAQGVLSSIFWKPEMRWIIEQIEVLAPVRWITMRRNEAEIPITRDAIKAGYLDLDQHRQQRMTLMLRDVHYRISAQVWVHPDAREQDPAKWRDQFQRRVKRGQCFRTPFMGMREFHADVVPIDGTKPIKWTEDLGVMLHSIHYHDGKESETYDWFEAAVADGIMHVPARGLALQDSAIETGSAQ